MKLFWPIIGILIIASVIGIIWASFTLISQPETDKQVQFTEPLPTEFCWNKVIEEPGKNPYWPNACNTAETSKDDFCAQMIIELNEEQIAEYEGWKVAGKPRLIGC